MGTRTTTITLTIKQVPHMLAKKLRQRAAVSHRSLQGELMLILEQAVDQASLQAQETISAYKVKRLSRTTRGKAGAHGKRMGLGELWERARRLGPPSRSESPALIRSLRDGRYRR